MFNLVISVSRFLSSLLIISVGTLFCSNAYSASGIDSIWNDLSDFEILALESKSKAEKNDPDALLLMYLAASGDIRSLEEYESIKARIDKFIESFKTESKGLKSHEKIGEKLHERMHETFFLGGNSGNEMGKGYYFEQSKLSEVFYSKRFNCISSTLLYIVLARHMGLDVQGVSLPSHSFVQLNLRNGTAIEIETTSPYGFNLVHDKEFYEVEDSSWFEIRGLEPSTYEQYLDRKLLSPYQTGILNMQNQHTFSENMHYDSRFRLAEVASVFADSELELHKYRLSFYNNEFNKMNDGIGHHRLIAMVKKVTPYVNSLQKYKGKDAELDSFVAWTKSHQIYTKFLEGNLEESAKEAIKAYRKMHKSIKDAEGIKKNYLFILHKVADQYIGKEQFELASKVFGPLTKECVSKKDCQPGIARIYGEWASYHWRKEAWDSVLNVTREYLTIDENSESRKIFISNAASASSNWAVTLGKNYNWQKAKQVLNDCIKDFSAARICKDHLENIKDMKN